MSRLPRREKRATREKRDTRRILPSRQSLLGDAPQTRRESPPGRRPALPRLPRTVVEGIKGNWLVKRGCDLPVVRTASAHCFSIENGSACDRSGGNPVAAVPPRKKKCDQPASASTPTVSMR